MTELHDLPYNQKIRLTSFHITNTYNNIPTKKVPQIATLLCDQQNVTKRFKLDIAKLTRTLLKQNYFLFQDRVYKQQEGLAMEFQCPPFFSELYLPNVEHTILYDILIHNRVLG
jgi:hypothetical protein